MKSLKTIKRDFFSLIEMVSAIAILAFVIAISFQFLSSTQKIMEITQSSRGVAEDARIALDLIARDLQSAYYGNDNDGYAPFWHWVVTPRPSGWDEYRNELIAFVSNTPNPPNTDCTTGLCEVKYQLYYAAGRTTPDDKEFEGWLRRSVTGNITNEDTPDTRWNWDNNFKVGYTTDSVPTAAFTANSISSQAYQKLIPFVTDLKFDCFNKAGAEILADASTDNSTTSHTISATQFPYSVTITLTLLDDKSWSKWKVLPGSNPLPSNDTDPAKTFRENNQKTFTRTVYIGDRGQE